MPTRSGDGFSFPIRKFDDGQGLYTNFKYLEQWLRRLGQGGGVVGVARLGVDVDGVDPWTPGFVEWGDGDAVIEDEFGLIGGFSGTDDIHVHVASPGLYLIEFSLQLNRSTDASAVSWQHWQTSITQTTSGGSGIHSAEVTQFIYTDADTNISDMQEYVTAVMRIDDITNRISFASSTLRSAANAATEFNAIYLVGYDSTPSVQSGTYAQFTKLA